MSDVDSLSPQSVVIILHLSINSGYGPAAATTALLWDIMITLRREVYRIGPEATRYHSRVNWTTLFYIITRYLPVIVSSLILTSNALNVALSGLFIRRLSIFYTISWFVVLGCTEILFMKRIIALYGGSKLLLRILTGLFICELISALVAFFLFAWENESVVHITLGPDLLVTSVVFSEIYFAFPELVFQAILVILIMQKVILDSNWRSGAANSNLVSTLIRDGLWSYFFNLCGLLVIVIRPEWLSGPFGLPNLLWSYVTFSITSTRLILNLREVAARQTVSNNASTVGSRTRIIFGRNIRSFLGSANDELSRPYHYHDLGHDSESDNDD